MREQAGTDMVDYAEKRKQLVAQVRESFEEDHHRQEDSSWEPGVETWWMRMRFFAALLLFALFFFWQGSGENLYGHTSGELVERITETRYDGFIQDILSGWQ